jgi:hypothetical protein
MLMLVAIRFWDAEEARAAAPALARFDCEEKMAE